MTNRFNSNAVSLIMAFTFMFMLVSVFVLGGAAVTGCAPIAGEGGGIETTGEAGEKTRIFTDSCGRTVELPEVIERVAPSGQTAQMMIYAVKPDALIGLSAEFTQSAIPYIPEQYLNLPVFGQFYGKSAGLNMEALIAADPQVIIDLGDIKSTHSDDMDAIQEQTGIPTIFIEANMDTYAKAMTTLGELLGAPEQGSALSAYITETLEYAADRRLLIAEDSKVGVYFGTGVSGLDANAAGSTHATVLDIVGARNVTVVDEISSRGGGNTISMEQLYVFNPDVIILMPDGGYDAILADETWGELSAVSQGRCYEIPQGPFNFMSSPPSVNQIIGVKWLGNLIYPELYDLDIAEELKEFYLLFWSYDLTDAEVATLLAHSSFRQS